MATAVPLDLLDSPEVRAAAREMFEAASAARVRVTEEELLASLRGMSARELPRIVSEYKTMLRDMLATGLDPNLDPLSGDFVTLDQAIDDGSLGVTRAEWEQICASSA